MQGVQYRKSKAMGALFPALSLILFTLIFSFPSLCTSLYPNGRSNVMNRGCDIFQGEWVPNPNAPYYTNETCWLIYDKQNCMKFGRPDSEYMKWRWKPDECELPVFDPARFLEIVRGKSLAFVGDSLGRNHMQALMCQLLRVSSNIDLASNRCRDLMKIYSCHIALVCIRRYMFYGVHHIYRIKFSAFTIKFYRKFQVTYVKDVSSDTDYKSRTWLFPTHNLTIANFWSPLLVDAKEAEPNGHPYTGLYSLNLDEPDNNWTAHITKFDYVIISAGHWFFRPLMYYENNKLVGCSHCNQENVTDLTMYYGYARAFRTSFKALYTVDGFNGTAFLRTYSPDHFENGEWNKGGDCTRAKPFKRSEKRFDGFEFELYMTQVEEFRAAESEARRRGLKFRLLNTTGAMLLRPDGHPSRYGHWPNEKVLQYNDCVHWCLPGPVDVWNDFLLQILNMEGLRSFVS